RYSELEKYIASIKIELENITTKKQCYEFLEKFNLKAKKSDLREWKKLVKTIRSVKKPVRIAMVGKYFETGSFTLMDSYISVIESIKHAAWYYKRKPEICWLSASDYEKNPKKLKELKEYDGVIIPGGFGKRGVGGKMKAIEFCRKNKIPYFGLCYGLQLAVVEFARNVCGLKKAASVEFDPNTPHPVIDVMEEQKVLLKEKFVDDAISRAYYSAFLSAKALLLLLGSDVKTHSGLITMFNLKVVRGGLLPREIGRYLSELFEARQTSDYSPISLFDI
ncbi:MAG: glutamine amidotransferase-related protein, partial [Candidatus Asgardarchaeia archaeon]